MHNTYVYRVNHCSVFHFVIVFCLKLHDMLLQADDSLAHMCGKSDLNPLQVVQILQADDILAHMCGKLGLKL